MGAVAVAAVADDLTGAAELAAVGWRRGLEAEVHTEAGLSPRASLAVLDTDSRTRDEAQARARSRAAGDWLIALEADLVYKKVDSVLRGWVRAETEELLRRLGRSRALLLPANPGLGRVVRDGLYFVEGRPVHETDFARDPLHPIRSSDVLTMLGAGGSLEVGIGRARRARLADGITVGEAASRKDLVAWAGRVDEGLLPAGGAEFFDALLEARGLTLRTFDPAPPASRERRLVVSGTTSDRSRDALQRARKGGVPVLPLPEALLRAGEDPSGLIQRWAEDTVSALDRSPVAAVTIGGPVSSDPADASRLERLLADLVGWVLEARQIGAVLVEGGATAAAVIRRLQWTRLTVLRELAPGVVSLRPDAPRAPSLTMKPGSYAWPETVWR